MMQQETGDLKESEYGNVDFGTPTDDEEVTIPSQDRNKEVPDFPDIDIHDEQTLSNTQREDWLIPTEPLHGARPRQTGRERPPVIDNRPPMDATGGAAVRKPGRTLRLSPGRQILMEEEVITLPRGGGASGPLSLRVHHVQYLNLSLMIFRRTVYGMVVAWTADFDGRGGDHTAEGGGASGPLSLRVHHVQYLNLSLMIFRTVYGMAVCVKRILDRQWIC